MNPVNIYTEINNSKTKCRGAKGHTYTQVSAVSSPTLVGMVPVRPLDINQLLRGAHETVPPHCAKKGSRRAAPRRAAPKCSHTGRLHTPSNPIAVTPPHAHDIP
eukprot:223923-Prorocentrum_minimum.AAC.1